MLKFAKTAKVGDTIRAYDFAPCAGRDDAFIEGIVQEVDSMESGFLSYKIEVTAEKWIKFETKPSKKNRVGKTMFVPYQTLTLRLVQPFWLNLVPHPQTDIGSFCPY